MGRVEALGVWPRGCEVRVHRGSRPDLLYLAVYLSPLPSFVFLSLPCLSLSAIMSVIKHQS